MEETRKQPTKLEGPGGALLGEVIGAVLTVGVLGFWFGIGAALGSKVVNDLEELVIALMSYRCTIHSLLLICHVLLPIT